MATHDSIRYYPIQKFWDDEFKNLLYINEPFNDTEATRKWLAAGYPNKFTGDMCDMRAVQPVWNEGIIDVFKQMGWKDIGTSYYRMGPGTILPTHSDLYLRYIDIHGLRGREQTIRRAVVFLEDWKPGHYAEYCDTPYTGWKAGQTVEWAYDAPHMAANMGLEDRYTLQVTGHV
jgi:hypothetical protein